MEPQLSSLLAPLKDSPSRSTLVHGLGILDAEKTRKELMTMNSTFTSMAYQSTSPDQIENEQARCPCYDMSWPLQSPSILSSNTLSSACRCARVSVKSWSFEMSTQSFSPLGDSSPAARWRLFSSYTSKPLGRLQPQLTSAHHIHDNTFNLGSFLEYSMFTPCKQGQEIFPFDHLHFRNKVDTFTIPTICAPRSSTPIPSESMLSVTIVETVDSHSAWLKDLRMYTEPECLHSFQNKWLTACCSEEGFYKEIEVSSGIPLSSPHTIYFSTDVQSNMLNAIRDIIMARNLVSEQFSQICKKLELGELTKIPEQLNHIVEHIQGFLWGTQGPSPPSLPGYLDKLEEQLEYACFELSTAASMNMGKVVDDCTNCSHISGTAVVKRESFLHVVDDVMMEGIVNVGNLFSEVVDLRLLTSLDFILDIGESSEEFGEKALKSLLTVMDEGDGYLCRLGEDIDIVGRLLRIIMCNRDDADKILSLRCLSAILAIGENINEFHEADSLGIIAKLLNDPAFSFTLKLEAISVLKRATDPLLDDDSPLMNLGPHLEGLIVAMTNLLTTNLKWEHESFQVIVAALANLTNLDMASIDYIRRHGTIAVITSSVLSNSYSLFVFNNVATIIANMASAESCRSNIIKSGAIDCLLHFLHQTEHHFPDKGSCRENYESAVAACERLQQKSAIALSRLANHDDVPAEIFLKGGLHRLITICRRKGERNFSDGVLIAALAAVRKIVNLLGPEHRKVISEAKDLLLPRLLDSYFLFSSRKESYV